MGTQETTINTEPKVYIQIDESHIVAFPDQELKPGDRVIVFHHPDGEYAIHASFFDKIKALSSDKSITVDKLRLLIKVPLV